MKFVPNKSAIARLEQDAARQMVPDLQRRLDELGTRCSGLPVEDVKAALVKDFASHGGKITEPDLSNFAERIANGERIEVRVGR